ncbi:MAG TPA: Flp pilus assembly protein CpaB [Candidatus Dormibacteraeota bacterium]|nr:Flp pilus assembly protein CpaB [Candidatus Dormibacteraeota bacterium]
MSGRPFTIIGAVVAVVALGVFLLLGNRAGGGAGGGGAITTKSVVVAARDISSRVPLTAADVTVVKMDAAAIPPQSFDKVSQLTGLIPVVNVYKDQPLTANLLVSSSDQVTGTQEAFLPIPKGFVAKTIPTSEQQGVAFFIQPGDYITIEGLVPGAKFQNERTIFTNVHVLKTGVASANVAPATTKGAPTPAPQTATAATSLTIVVTQCQAEIIDWFIANGTIKYTLESYKDYTPKDQAVDQTCPGVDSAGGVTAATINSKYPGLLGT